MTAYLGAHNRNLSDNNDLVASGGSYPYDSPTRIRESLTMREACMEDSLLMMYSKRLWNYFASSTPLIARYNRPLQQIQVTIMRSSNISSRLAPIASAGQPLGTICANNQCLTPCRVQVE